MNVQERFLTDVARAVRNNEKIDEDFFLDQELYKGISDEDRHSMINFICELEEKAKKVREVYAKTNRKARRARLPNNALNVLGSALLKIWKHRPKEQ